MDKHGYGKKSCQWATVTLLALGVIMLTTIPITAAAQESSLPLLKPQTDTQPFLKLLAKRTSARSFSTQTLPLQTLSNLLWSAFGISRPRIGQENGAHSQ